MVKVWLDDIRPAPEGWVHLKHPQDVIRLLGCEVVDEISLDHDLGIWEDGREVTGYEVLIWLERAVCDLDTFPIPIINIHTANPVAYKKMDAARTYIYKRRESNVQNT